MKKADCKPGTLIMCAPPGNGYSIDLLKSGQWGYPGMILAFGKFRRSHSGLCGYTAVPSEWESTDKVVVLRSLGYVDDSGRNRVHVSESTPKQEWVVDVMSKERVMHFEAWQELRAELELIATDVEAINFEISQLRRQAHELREGIAHAWIKEHAQDITVSIVHGMDSRTFQVVIPIEAFGEEVLAELEATRAKMDELQAKVSCAQRIYN